MKRIIKKLCFLVIACSLISCGSASNSDDEPSDQQTDNTANPPASKESYLILDGDGDMAMFSDKRICRNEFPINSFTAEAWIYPNTQSDMMVIFSRDYYELKLVSKGVTLDGIKRLDLSATGIEGRRDYYYLPISAPNAVKVNEWNHVAFVHDEEKDFLILAVNGEIVASTGATDKFGATINLNCTTISIGDHNNDLAGDYEGHKWDFSGKIGHVRFSNVARYTGKYDPQRTLEADLKTITLWTFDEKEGDTTFFDKSANHFDISAVGDARIGS